MKRATCSLMKKTKYTILNLSADILLMKYKEKDCLENCWKKIYFLIQTTLFSSCHFYMMRHKIFSILMNKKKMGTNIRCHYSEILKMTA